MDIESGEGSSGYLYSISDSGTLYRGRGLGSGGDIEAYRTQSDTWVESPEDYIFRYFYISGEFERISQDEAEAIVDEAREARSQWSDES